ncbi:MAG: hypothetical protein HS115_02580 [Spirochaetales bacterium]|nr:hypothetical protein [Spirochaetales bacterium]
MSVLTMFFLYNLLLHFLYPLYRLSALLHPGMREFHISRQNLSQELQRQRRAINKPVYWLHASSVGELDQAGAIARALREEKDVCIAVSVFSSSVRQAPAFADLFFRFPLDFRSTWLGILPELRPAAYVTMTWDVWPNLLYTLKESNIPAFLCSAALGANSRHLIWPYRLFYRRCYSLFRGIGVVDRENFDRFCQLAPGERIRITGDSRYDSILEKLKSGQPPAELQRLRELYPPGGRDRIILASTYKSCEETLFPLLSGLLEKKFSVLIFPHHIGEERLEEIERKIFSATPQAAVSRLSQAKARPDILLVDRLGLLAFAYHGARFCYVGGALHHRVHNTGEPAACGVAVVTGPAIQASPVALALEKQEALWRCQNTADFARRFQILCNDPELARNAGERGRAFIKGNAGSSRQFVKEFL